MTRVKICGVTHLDDARAAVRAGADAIGFVFAPSPRRVTAETAAAIVRELPPLVTTVGVFVDAPTAEIESIVSRTGIDVIQLHGSETPDDCARCARPVIKRFAVSGDDGASDVAERVTGYRVSAYLLDPGSGGGATFPWSLARALHGPVIIAGGLNPSNVRSALVAARPYGVDVCSGVECRPGRKDPASVRAFVRAVREQDVARCSDAESA